MSDEQPLARPMLNQRQAADACGVSRTTIRRARDAGRLPHAELAEGTWMIPVGDLLAAGFRIGAPAPPDAAPDSGPDETQDEAGAPAVLELERRLHEVELELATARTGHAVAEARLEEVRAQLRDRGEHIETLQRALAALAPAPDRAAIPSPAPPPADTTPAAAASTAAVPTTQAGTAEPARRRWRWGGR